MMCNILTGSGRRIGVSPPRRDSADCEVELRRAQDVSSPKEFGIYLNRLSNLIAIPRQVPYQQFGEVHSLVGAHGVAGFANAHGLPRCIEEGGMPNKTGSIGTSSTSPLDATYSLDYGRRAKSLKNRDQILSFNISKYRSSGGCSFDRQSPFGKICNRHKWNKQHYEFFGRRRYGAAPDGT